MSKDVVLAALQRLSEDNFTVAELLGAIDLLSREGDMDSIRDLYRGWLDRRPDDPLRFLVLYNFGSWLSSQGELPEARTALERSIALNGDYLPAHINLGYVLERMGGRIEAVATWMGALNRMTQVTGENVHYVRITLSQMGRVFEQANLRSNAEDVYRRCLELDPNQPEVMRHYLSMMQQQCKWPIARPFGALGQISRRDCLTNIDPLTLGIYSDDPLFQLANSYFYNKLAVGEPEVSFAHGHRARLLPAAGKRLKIGYLSSDLRQHAVGYLTVELFEQHNRDAVEIYVYHSGPSADDPIGHRVRKAVEHWTDITTMADEQAARLMVADGIQILVDLNGHTSGVRSKVLAMRPAPVIVNWLGYPGTLGSAYHNYIIADPFIVPPDHERYYSEKVMRLPCYQPNDRKRLVSPVTPSRQDEGLPADAMVYCSFNGQHKITPHTWRRWTSILRQVDDSVLWLLDSSEEICNQIRSLLAQEGIAGERLIFGKRIGNADHLARYPLADLFLDTTPYGAHTTASDAMWMGVPIITLAGRSFASRVCGSIIRSAGLGELVCENSEHYVARAVELGRNRDQLEAYRQRLRASRDSCVLFDTPLLARSIEALYREMWRDFERDQLPQPDLSNMELYRDIAIELDDDAIESSTRTDYLDLYRRKIDHKSSYRFVAKDGRVP